MLTDHEGKFEFDHFVLSGSGVVEVRKPGFYFGATIGGTTTILFHDQMTSPVVLRLYPEALMTGTITAPDGSPLPRIVVSAMRSVYNESGHMWFPMGHSLTNSRGEFRMTVPAGDYRIETNFSPLLPGSADAVLPVTLPPTPDSLIHMSSGSQEKFELHPIVSRTYSVGVRIDLPQERGNPSLLARASDGSMFSVRVLRGANNGEVHVALPSGTFTLIASLNRGGDMEYGEANITVTDHDLSGVVLRLASVPSIPVQMIVDPGSTSDKAPSTAQQLGVMLQNMQGPRIGMSSFFVRVQNQEASFHPTPGVYRFIARSYGQWFIKSATYGTTDILKENMTVTWGGAASAPIFVTISNKTGGLQGTVQLEGAAAAAWLYAIPIGPSAVPVYTGHCNANGSFNFPSLPPGGYKLVAFEDRYWTNYMDPESLRPYAPYVHNVTITAGENATANLEAVPNAEIRP
jgi:hypothetical protein